MIIPDINLLVYAYNSVVTRNTMSGIDASGIWLRHSSNNAILSNVIYGKPPEGVVRLLLHQQSKVLLTDRDSPLVRL